MRSEEVPNEVIVAEQIREPIKAPPSGFRQPYTPRPTMSPSTGRKTRPHPVVGAQGPRAVSHIMAHRRAASQTARAERIRDRLDGARTEHRVGVKVDPWKGLGDLVAVVERGCPGCWRDRLDSDRQVLCTGRGCGVIRATVADDDLEVIQRKCTEAPPDHLLFVVGRNDDTDHRCDRPDILGSLIARTPAIVPHHWLRRSRATRVET